MFPVMILFFLGFFFLFMVLATVNPFHVSKSRTILIFRMAECYGLATPHYIIQLVCWYDVNEMDLCYDGDRFSDVNSVNIYYLSYRSVLY